MTFPQHEHYSSFVMTRFPSSALHPFLTWTYFPLLPSPLQRANYHCFIIAKLLYRSCIRPPPPTKHSRKCMRPLHQPAGQTYFMQNPLLQNFQWMNQVRIRVETEIFSRKFETNWIICRRKSSNFSTPKHWTLAKVLRKCKKKFLITTLANMQGRGL